METIREHLWRIFLDWPEFTGASSGNPTALAEIMEIQRAYEKAMFAGAGRFSQEEMEFKPVRERFGLLQNRIGQILTARVYGISPERWLDMESPAQLDAWMDSRQTVAASYLGKVRAMGWEAAGSNDNVA
ncbi:MAG: hypothetical protein L3J26_02195 [Candidatus Polarisedimenticolaceae bacterium]|nr:hypothetical protein [Candidatus Polarisedimenticolaceae bacterium]